MQQMGFYFNQTRCMGCRTCMVACKDQKGLMAGPAALRKFHDIEGPGEFPTAVATYLVHSCNHCAHPKCVEVCPTASIKKRSDSGIVVVNRDTCIGKAQCGKCQSACPWSIPSYADDMQEPVKESQWASAHPSLKCDMCIELLVSGKKPACVDSCMQRAIDCGTIEYLKAKYPDATTTAMGFESGVTEPSILFKSK